MSKITIQLAYHSSWLQKIVHSLYNSLSLAFPVSIFRQNQLRTLVKMFWISKFEHKFIYINLSYTVLKIAEKNCLINLTTLRFGIYQTTYSLYNHLLESISPTCLRTALRVKIPKVQKDSQVISVFLPFWKQLVQKLLVKHWWNRPLICVVLPVFTFKERTYWTR